MDEGSYLIADKRYLLDVISAEEIDEDLIEGYKCAWKPTGLKRGILVNIQPDTAVVEIERFRI